MRTRIEVQLVSSRHKNIKRMVGFGIMHHMNLFQTKVRTRINYQVRVEDFQPVLPVCRGDRRRFASFLWTLHVTPTKGVACQMSDSDRALYAMRLPFILK
jgi:hypothetical protein